LWVSKELLKDVAFDSCIRLGMSEKDLGHLKLWNGFDPCENVGIE
jgi:hypothetical protein